MAVNVSKVLLILRLFYESKRVNREVSIPQALRLLLRQDQTKAHFHVIFILSVLEPASLASCVFQTIPNRQKASTILQLNINVLLSVRFRPTSSQNTETITRHEFYVSLVLHQRCMVRSCHLQNARQRHLDAEHRTSHRDT